MFESIWRHGHDWVSFIHLLSLLETPIHMTFWKVLLMFSIYPVQQHMQAHRTCLDGYMLQVARAFILLKIKLSSAKIVLNERTAFPLCKISVQVMENREKPYSLFLWSWGEKHLYHVHIL